MSPVKFFFSPQEHLERALALRDDDPMCFYLLGKWCYEVRLWCESPNDCHTLKHNLVCVCFGQVATLDWLEKKAAAAVYQSPPTSSLHDALENFLKVPDC